MLKKLLTNPSAGEILKTEFLEELGMSQNALARAINVPPNRIHDIVKGKRSITADTDLRLCKFFDLTEGYFLRLQLTYEKRSMQDQVKKIKPYSVRAEVSTQASKKN